MTLPIHPILFSLFPIIFIFSNNISHLSLDQILDPTLWTLSITLTIWFSLKLYYRNVHQAATLTSWLAILFFSYGATYDSLGKVLSLIQSHWLLLMTWSLIGTAGVYILNQCHSKIEHLSHAANWIALCLLGPSIGLLTINSWISPISVSIEAARAAENIPLPHQPQNRPNIYYIVLDAYGGQPALQKYFDFPNQEFIDFLSHKGFQVNNQAKANYNQTWLALSSALNLDYVQNLLPNSTLHSKDRQPLKRLIQDNMAVKFLQKLGYSIVCLQSGLSFTRWDKADILAPPRKAMDEFFLLWLSLTPIRGAFSIIGDLSGTQHSPYQSLRERIQYSLDHLPDYANTPTPSFIFAHILAPHPPFVFGPNGQPLDPDRKYAIGDGSEFYANGGTQEEYRRNYIGEIKYLNSQLKETIRKILIHSERQPVILIQADHGSRMHLDWQSFENTDTEEVFSILHALYIPDRYRDNIPVNISPVNNFRLLFNILFDTHLPLLTNKSFFSPWEELFQFYPVDHTYSAHDLMSQTEQE